MLTVVDLLLLYWINAAGFEARSAERLCPAMRSKVSEGGTLLKQGRQTWQLASDLVNS
jgi:hypothetical protein